MRFSALSWCIALATLILGSGCEPEQEPAQVESKEASEVSVELTDSFLIRATSALSERLLPDSKVLELRVSGAIFSVHMQAEKDLPASEAEKAIPAGTLVQIDYVETPGETGQPPIGRIRGPLRVPVKGTGEVSENVFAYSEVDLKAIGRALRIAKISIDPEDGRVTQLIVRRNLPFGKRVRARIFVDSPRMAGTIDVNEKGAPLKR